MTSAVVTLAVGKTLNRIRELGGAPPLSLPSEAE